MKRRGDYPRHHHTSSAPHRALLFALPLVSNYKAFSSAYATEHCLHRNSNSRIISDRIALPITREYSTTTLFITIASSTMFRSVASILIALLAVELQFQDVAAFSSMGQSTRVSSATSLFGTSPSSDEGMNDSVLSRRQALVGFASLAAGVAASVAKPSPASATYSEYTRREKDWQDRLEKGEVKITSSRQLKLQLQEIAPMNTEGSRIFCPNGASPNVSPLMENRCGDRLALPSVYGRTEDVLGNSIPGFKEGYAWSPSSSSTSMSASMGGFPAYNPKNGINMN